MNSKQFKYMFGFNKSVPVPLYLRVGQHLGYIIDGLTGLIMIPFGRYGTNINLHFLGEILRCKKPSRRT